MQDTKFIQDTKTYIEKKNELLEDSPFYYKLHFKGYFLGGTYRLNQQVSVISALSSIISFKAFYFSCFIGTFYSQPKLQNLWRFHFGLAIFFSIISITSKSFEVYFKRYSPFEFILPISDLIFWLTHYYLLNSGSPSLFWNCLTIIPLILYSPLVSILIYEKRIPTPDYVRALPLRLRLNGDILIDFITRVLTFITFGYFSGTLRGKIFKILSGGILFSLPFFITVLVIMILILVLFFERERRRISRSAKILKNIFLGLACCFSLYCLYSSYAYLNLDFRFENLEKCFEDKKISLCVLTILMAILGIFLSLDSVNAFFRFWKSN